MSIVPAPVARPIIGARVGAGATGAGALVAVALAAAVYHPITGNYFRGDDFLNLFNAVNRSPWALIVQMHGGHLLLTTNALLIVFFRLFGPEPASYFWVVLLTHLANVALLFVLIVRLTRRPWLAAFGAALWGVLPANEGSLGWYAVYGHVIATTAVLAVLTGLARLAAGAPPRPGAVVLWTALLFAASTSFGVAIGVTLVMPLVAFLLVPPGPTRRCVVGAFAVVALGTPLLYLAVVRLQPAVGEVGLRLAPRGLAYWASCAEVFIDLLAYAAASILWGVVQSAPAYPAASTFAVLGAAGLLTIAVFARAPSTVRRQLVGLWLVAVAAYAMIAVGRGMFSGPVRDAMMTQPRFHYLGPAVLCVTAALALAEASRIVAWSTRLGHVFLPFWIAAVLLVRIRSPIQPADAARLEAEQTVGAIRQAIAATPPGADAHIENRPFFGVGPFIALDRARFPGWAGVFVVYFPANVVDGRRVVFLEADPRARAAAQAGRRTADLLASYESIGRAPPPEQRPGQR